MASKFEKFRNHWIWAVVVACISLGLTGLGIYLQFKSSRHELGGFLNATFHNKSIKNKESRTIIICVDDTTSYFQNIYITPTFDNSDEYSLRDFSLQFETTAEGVNLIPSSFVKLYRTGETSSIFKYEQDVLQAHMDTKNPFSGFKLMKDLARCEVTSKVSFDGAASLFTYRTDIWFVYTPNTGKLSYDYWKINCKQKVFNLIAEPCFDIYYISKNKAPEYQFDVLLSSGEKRNVSENKTSHIEKNTGEPKNIVSKGKNIDSTENSNKDIKKDICYKEGFITIYNYSNKQDYDSSELKVSDYILLPGDTLRYLVTFNQEVNESGIYIIKYTQKDGLFLKNKYSLINLKNGDNKCFLNINNNKKITDVEIYHRVDPSKYINSYIVIGTTISSDKNNILFGILSENGNYYIRENNYLTSNFDNPVTIEIFERSPYWYEKIFISQPWSLKTTIYLLGIIFLLSILFIFSLEISYNNFGLYFFYLMYIIFIIIIVSFFAIIAYIMGQFLYNYIYLSI